MRKREEKEDKLRNPFLVFFFSLLFSLFFGAFSKCNLSI